VTSKQPGCNASYTPLAVKAEKRFTRGTSFLASYTWSYMIDNGAGTLGEGVGTWRDFNNIALDRGNSNYGRRHGLAGTFIYNLPMGREGRFGANWGRTMNGMSGGWQLSGIGTVRSGRYFSVTASGNPGNISGTNYANRLSEGSLPPDQRSIDNWFDKSAFAVPAQYTYGNAGRNIFPSANATNLDAKMSKNFRFAGRYRREVRGEMFNTLNTANFGVPNGVIDNVNAGTINSAGPPRSTQLALKLMF
jgi:hypothetical protein